MFLGNCTVCYTRNLNKEMCMELQTEAFDLEETVDFLEIYSNYQQYIDRQVIFQLGSSDLRTFK